MDLGGEELGSKNSSYREDVLMMSLTNLVTLEYVWLLSKRTKDKSGRISSEKTSLVFGDLKVTVPSPRGEEGHLGLPGD